MKMVLDIIKAYRDFSRITFNCIPRKLNAMAHC